MNDIGTIVATSTRRLFFALWPDDQTRSALESARARLFPLAGRPVPVAGLHVTVAFLGSVKEARLPALLELRGAVPPLALTFDRLEHWPKARVLAATTVHLPDDLRRLADGLWQRLDRLGFARETRPFRPHVTLVRDVRSVRAGLPWVPFAWPVDRLELVESVPTAEGGQYKLVAGNNAP